MLSRDVPGGSSPAATTVLGGRYRLEGRIASGAMGEVYAAEDVIRGGRVALKRLHWRRDEAPEAARWFEREYRTLASLEHPRIIRVFEYGLDEDVPYFTMELIEGSDLKDLAPLPWRTACRYLRDIATSLALLHARGLIHRDVSPRNTRVTPDGHCMLLDFGALTTFGRAPKVVGTPPFVPPEALYEKRLDQRSDLFPLGALACYLLTGRHAFPAAHLEDLPQVWATERQEPLTLGDEAPAALTALVNALLSEDPQARPGNAAEVIERLEGIAGLQPEDAAATNALAASYLAGPEFGGRLLELDRLRKRLSRTGKGSGGVVLIEGDMGLGRTRLLQEAVLEAKLRSFVVLHADANGLQRPLEVAATLVNALLEALPSAAEMAPPQAALLAGVDPRLSDPLSGDGSQPALTELSGEWRGQVQAALYTWFERLSVDHRLLVAVDDIAEADDLSLGFLASLGRLADRGKLMLVATRRPSKEASGSPAMRDLADRAERMVLSPLAQQDVLALVRSLFGDVPNLARCAGWLSEACAGNPLLLMELVRELVAKEAFRHVGSTWILPEIRPTVELPRGLEQALTSRLADLPEHARQFAEAAALDPSVLAPERAAALLGDAAAADEAREALVRHQVLRAHADGHTFHHATLREALAAGLTDERRRQLHLRIAEALLQAPQSSQQSSGNFEVGWHLIRGGEEERGADLLAKAALKGSGIRKVFDDLHSAAPAIEEALRIYTERGRSVYERVPLLAALSQAAYYEHWRWRDPYGEEALAVLQELSGFKLALRLRRRVGAMLAMLLGMLWAWLRFIWAPRRTRRYPFFDLLIQYGTVVTALAGVAGLTWDGERGEQMIEAMSPVEWMPEWATPMCTLDFCRSLREICRERSAYALSIWRRLTDNLHNPRYYRTYPALTEGDRVAMLGGVLYARGVFESLTAGTATLDAADELDRIGTRYHEMIASQLRVLYHATRGEIAQMAPHKERVELYSIQMGSAWQVETWEPTELGLVHILIGDPAAVHHYADRLAATAQDLPAFATHAKLLHYGWRLARGESGGQSAAEFRAAAREIVLQAEPRSFLGWAIVHAFVARSYSQNGDYAEAIKWCERALQHITDEDRPFVLMFLEVEVQLALAEAGMGRLRRAATMLDALIEEHESTAGPLFTGRLHEARAQVAVLQDDGIVSRYHAAEADRLFRGTETASLVARADALQALVRANSRVRSEHPPPSNDHDTSSDQTSLAIRPGRWARSLSALKSRVPCDRAAIYQWTENDLVLRAPGDTAPGFERMRQYLVERAREYEQSTRLDGASLIRFLTPSETDSRPIVGCLIVAPDEGIRRVIAAAVLTPIEGFDGVSTEVLGQLAKCTGPEMSSEATARNLPPPGSR